MLRFFLVVAVITSLSAATAAAMLAMPPSNDAQVWRPKLLIPPLSNLTDYAITISQAMSSSPALFRGAVLIVRPPSYDNSDRSSTVVEDASFRAALNSVRNASSYVRNSKLKYMFDSTETANLVPSLESGPAPFPYESKAEAVADLGVKMVAFLNVSDTTRNVTREMMQFRNVYSTFLDGFYLCGSSEQQQLLQSVSAEIRKNATSKFVVIDTLTTAAAAHAGGDDDDGSFAPAAVDVSLLSSSDILLIEAARNATGRRMMRPDIIPSAVLTTEKARFAATFSLRKYDTFHNSTFRAATDAAFSSSIRGQCNMMSDFSPLLCHSSYIFLSSWKSSGGSLPVFFQSLLASLSFSPVYFPVTEAVQSNPYQSLGAPALNVRAQQAVSWLVSSNMTNVYRSGLGNAFLNLYGPTNSSASTQCATCVSLFLRDVFAFAPMTPATGSSYLFRWLGSNSPYAATYFSAFKAQNGFLDIADMRDVRPGDLVSMNYDDDVSVNTGHMMTVLNVTKVQAPSAPLVAGIMQWSVWVMDSSASYHGPRDTRKAPAEGGIGIGEARLYSTLDYQLWGYTWSFSSGSIFYNNSAGGVRQITIARPAYLYWFRAQQPSTTSTAAMATTTTTTSTTTMAATTSSTEPGTTATTTITATTTATTTTSASMTTMAPDATTTTTTADVYTTPVPSTGVSSTAAPTTTEIPTSTPAPTDASTTAAPTTTSTSEPAQTTQVPPTVAPPTTAVPPPPITSVAPTPAPTSSATAAGITAAPTSTTAVFTTTTTTTGTSGAAASPAPQTQGTTTAAAETTAAPTTTRVPATAAPTTPRPTDSVKVGARSEFVLKLKSIALGKNIAAPGATVAMMADLARFLQAKPSQVRVTFATALGALDVVVVTVAVSDLTTEYVASSAEALNTRSGTAGGDALFEATLQFLAGRESGATLSLLSAAADPITTTRAPSRIDEAQDYCTENMLVCVLPATGGFLVLVVIVVVLRQRARARRRVIDEVPLQNWAVTTGAPVAAFSAPPSPFPASATVVQMQKKSFSTSSPASRAAAAAPAADHGEDMDIDEYLNDLTTMQSEL